MRKNFLIGIVTSCIVLSSSIVYASPLSDEDKVILSQLKQQLDDNYKKQNDIENEIMKIDNSLSILQNDINNKQIEIDETQKELKDKEDELKEAENLLSNRLRGYYKSGCNSYDYVGLLLSSTSLSQFMYNVKVMSTMVKTDNDLVDKVTNLRDSVQEIYDSKLDAMEELANKQSELNSNKSNLDNKVNELNSSKQQILSVAGIKEDSLITPLVNLLQTSNEVSELSYIGSSLSSLKEASVSDESKVKINNALTELTTKLSVLVKAGEKPPQTDNPIILESYKYLGIPYLWGGTDPSKGLDCSGLTQLVYHNLGYDITRTTYTQVNQGVEIPVDLAQMKAGDLIFFGDKTAPHHVGLYIGDNMYIHAPHTGDVVKVSEGALRACCARRIIQ